MEGIFPVNISFRLHRVVSFVCSPCKESQLQLPAESSFQGEHTQQRHCVQANAMWSLCAPLGSGTRVHNTTEKTQNPAPPSDWKKGSTGAKSAGCTLCIHLSVSSFCTDSSL